MRVWSSGGCWVLALASVGCGAAVQQRQPVTVVPTYTPGVAMVIVRPTISKSSDSRAVDRAAEYVLICDARGADGMHCDIAPEVARDRLSRGVMPPGPAPGVDEGVGT